MYLKSVLVIAALALPGAALAQGKSGQGKTAMVLPVCSVMPSDATTLDCSCPGGFALGSVWGSGPYTGDSDICTAALHSGAIDAGGGNVSVSRESGLATYPGSDGNGVSTSAWNSSYDFSIRVASHSGMAEAGVAECSGLPSVGEAYTCACPANPPLLDVWGSGPYTGDSDVCTAAVHDGAIGKAGGIILVERRPGQDRYPGSSQNGVSTMDWGSYGESFAIAAASAGGNKAASYESMGACDGLPDGSDPMSCTCDSVGSGSVWGSGPYTGDSDICVAAVHAGAIGKDGGEVVIVRADGESSYTGSDANGVTTRNWGSYGESFEIILPQMASSEASAPSGAAADGSGDPAVCSVLPDGVDAYSCECGRGLARGDVWGSGPYTSDSDICTAARHAGVIRSFGGEVRVLRIQGLGFYTGSADNGVSTQEWDEQYDSSIIFDRN